MMSTKKCMSVVLAIIVAFILTSVAGEPKCSRYDYEERTLEKTIRMEMKCEAILNDVNTLKANVNDEIRKVKEDTKTLVQEVRTAAEDVEAEKEKLRNEIRTAAAEFEPTVVSFKAKLTNNVDVSQGATLVFQDVVSNHGTGYDAATGVFKAPVSGVYLMTLQLCVYYRKDLVVETVTDDQAVSHVLMCDHDRHTCYDHTDVVTLAAGSSFKFRSGTSSASSVTIQVDSTARTNYWAGVLLVKI